MECSYANGPHTKAVFTDVGLTWTAGGGHIPTFGFQRIKESNISADAHAWVAEGLAAGFAPVDYASVKMADEPGWYYPAAYEAAASRTQVITGTRFRVLKMAPAIVI